MMLEKTLISTMMKNGADENPLMLKTFEFVKKVSNLKYVNKLLSFKDCIVFIPLCVVLEFNCILFP